MFQWRYLPRFIGSWLAAIWFSFFPPKDTVKATSSNCECPCHYLGRPCFCTCKEEL